MESKYDMIKFNADDINAIRKEYNLDTKEKREEAYNIIETWLQKQDHLVKKTYSKDYLERCLLMNKGSIERTKLQIDKMCTLRTVHKKYFVISNVKDKMLMETANKCHFGYAPRLTKEGYRVFIIKLKHDIDAKPSDFINFQNYLLLMGEFLKNVDYNRGYIFIADCLDVNIAEVLAKNNLSELQQFVPILTEGQGGKIKGIIFLTTSKLIEGFIKLVKPFFKEKVRNRIHVANNKERLKEWISTDILPEDYGGLEKPLEQLHDDLLTTLSSEPVQELFKEMNAACTDETKRQQDVFNEQYMGMAGTFRTMTLD